MGPPLREILTPGELAEALELSNGQLAWLADARGWERDARGPRAENYTYLWRPRRDGPPRLIERPKHRLKEIQRLLLRHRLACDGPPRGEEDDPERPRAHPSGASPGSNR